MVGGYRIAGVKISLDGSPQGKTRVLEPALFSFLRMLSCELSRLRSHVGPRRRSKNCPLLREGLAVSLHTATVMPLVI